MTADSAEQQVAIKLAAARTRLILDKPFLGALVLRLPLKAAQPDWCPTTATDARHFYYNSAYIESLNLAQTEFALAHEALHCALSHFARRQHRQRHRWDLACDLAINPLLIEDGLRPPPQALSMAEYSGMTAEEIYPLIEEDDQRETMDRHAYDDHETAGSVGGPTPRDAGAAARPETAPAQESESAGLEPEPSDGAAPPIDEQPAGQPESLGAEEQRDLAVRWHQYLAGAAQQALRAGRLGGTMQRLIEHLLQPQLPWRQLLAQHLVRNARDDFSYSRPSRREGSFIRPRLRSEQIDLVIAVDTSGSIKEPEIQSFVAEIEALKGQIRARVTLLPCDAELAPGAPWIFQPWEEFCWPADIQGGGGTCFKPVFEWIERQGVQPEALVYFTDADGEFPEHAAWFPVIWLVKGKRTVPWGRRIQLN